MKNMGSTGFRYEVFCMLSKLTRTKFNSLVKDIQGSFKYEIFYLSAGKLEGLTVIVRPNDRLRRRRIAAEETDGLAVGRQLPLLAGVLVAVLLVARHLGEHVVHYAGLLVQVGIGLHLGGEVLDEVADAGLLEGGVAHGHDPLLHELDHALLEVDYILTILGGLGILMGITMEGAQRLRGKPISFGIANRI